MSEASQKTPPPDIWDIKKGQFTIRTIQGQDHIVVTAFEDEGHTTPASESTIISLIGGAGVRTGVLFRSIRWSKQPIPGQMYFFKAVALNSEGVASEPAFFKCPANGNGNHSVEALAPAPEVQPPAPPVTEVQPQRTEPANEVPSKAEATPQQEQPPAPAPVVETPSKPTPAPEVQPPAEPVKDWDAHLADNARIFTERADEIEAGLKTPDLDELGIKDIEGDLIELVKAVKANKKRWPENQSIKKVWERLEGLDRLLREQIKKLTPAHIEAPPRRKPARPVTEVQPQRTEPDPAPTLPDLTPRINSLEGDIAGIRVELAGKASKEDMDELSLAVGQTQEGLKTLGQSVDAVKSDCETGFRQTREGLKSLNETLKAMKTHPTPAPAIEATPRPEVSPPTPSVTEVQPRQQRPEPPIVVNSGARNGNWWRTAKKVVGLLFGFLGFILGLVALVGLIMSLYFHASREQAISADRVDAAGAKASANAEIEAARRLQMESVEKLNGLKMEVEGMRRKMLATPPPPPIFMAPPEVQPQQRTVPPAPPAPVPTPSPAPEASDTTNHVTVIIRTIVSPPVTVAEVQPQLAHQYETAYWSPTPMMNRYGYDRQQGFEGYRYHGW